MRTNDLSIDARRARLIALFAVAAAAAISTSGCGGGDDSPAPAPAPAPTALTCDDSMKTAFKPDANTTVVAVKAFKKGDPLALSGTPATPAPAAAANDLCMVKLNVGPGNPGPASAPSTSPGIGIEVWLPTPANWNQRIHNLGGGGWQGGTYGNPTLIGSASAAALAGTEGSVVAGTDTGHPGAGALDPNFGFNPDGTFNSTLLTDFNERSVLELAVKTKALTQAYYQQPQKFAYFEGCSTGGRQGYYMLQNHPEHYNGYILGAPSFSWFKFVTSADLYPQVVIQRELGGVPLTAAQRNLVNGQAVSTCDVVGGQHLGFVLDPEQCKYDPTRDATVLCAGTTGAGGVVGTNSTAACVTPVQAQTMNKLWYGATADGSVPDPAVNNGYSPTVSGAQLWYGLSRGTNTSAIAGTPPFSIATDTVAFELQDTRYGGPNLLNASGNGADLWKMLTYGQVANAFYQGIALQPFVGNIDTDAKANLAAARAAKVRVLTWHGLSDTLIPPQNSINYYTRVVANDGGFAATQTYDRLFMIAGMAHCAGVGTAQGTAGVSPAATANSVPLPAAGQLFNVVKDWVENGTTPGSITLQSADASASQLLCPYPQKPTYGGSGAITAASSYSCK